MGIRALAPISSGGGAEGQEYPAFHAHRLCRIIAMMAA
jgi:hypothetical protein